MCQWRIWSNIFVPGPVSWHQNWTFHVLWFQIHSLFVQPFQLISNIVPVENHFLCLWCMGSLEYISFRWYKSDFLACLSCLVAQNLSFTFCYLYVYCLKIHQYGFILTLSHIILPAFVIGKNSCHRMGRVVYSIMMFVICFIFGFLHASIVFKAHQKFSLF